MYHSSGGLDNGGCYACGGRKYMGNLYLLLNFAVKLKLLLKSLYFKSYASVELQSKTKPNYILSIRSSLSLSPLILLV